MSSSPPNTKTKCIGIRHLQYFLMALGVVVCYAVRATLSVAIIAMTSKTPPNPQIPTYPEWSNQEVILSSFFWGYILLQIGAGKLSQRFGSKWFLLAAIALNGISCILIPMTASNFGSVGVILCRALQGLFQGFLFPCCHSLISLWTPIQSRSKVAGFIYGSANIGVILGMLLTGVICDSSFGWMYTFYLFGGLSILWGILWGLCGANSPAEHKWISLAEKVYLETTNESKENVGNKLPTPWKAILFSLPVWSLLFCNLVHAWGTYTLLTQIPTYMANMMNFKLSENSQLSSLPYIAQFLVSVFLTPVIDWLIVRKTMSTSNARKLSQSLSYFPAAAALLWLGFIDSEQKTLAICLLVIAVGITGLSLSGFAVSHIDLAPNHSGVLMGITNGLGSIFSILGPLSIGWFPFEKTDQRLWKSAFWLTAAFYASSGLFYLVFGSAKLQPWNNCNSPETAAEPEDKNSKAHKTV